MPRQNKLPPTQVDPVQPAAEIKPEAPISAPITPAFAGSASQERWQALKQRYALSKFGPYAEALARLEPIDQKLAESSTTVGQLRAEADRLQREAKQTDTESIEARAGSLLGIGSQAKVSAAQEAAAAARARADQAASRLHEAEGVHAVVKRAHTLAREEVVRQAQAAKEDYQPKIRAEHEAAVRRVALAFRELSAALAAEQDIRDATEIGPVISLHGLGDERINIREFIHTESLPMHLLDWFIKLEKFSFGEWISGFRKKGYPVD